MTLNITLDTDSINNAINQLIDAQDYLELGVSNLVDILVEQGADVAQAMYGGMATVTHVSDGTTGSIIASGEAVGIAEFGAGDDVIPVWFENNPDFPVFPGSYSLSDKGSRQYYDNGYWYFAGTRYQGIPARAGLLAAKEHIEEVMVDTAQEVIQL